MKKNTLIKISIILTSLMLFCSPVQAKSNHTKDNAEVQACQESNDLQKQPCLEKLAKRNNSQAQFQLGLMYYIGKSYSQALYWLNKSSVNGFVKAQTSLGLMYNEGKIVKKDYAKAIYWLTKAGNQGDATAQYELAYMYYDNLNIKQDKKKAKYWALKADKQGYPQAKQLLSYLQ